MDIFESEHSDIAWNKWNFRLFETKCHALALNYFRYIFESEHSDIDEISGQTIWDKMSCISHKLL